MCVETERSHGYKFQILSLRTRKSRLTSQYVFEVACDIVYNERENFCIEFGTSPTDIDHKWVDGPRFAFVHIRLHVHIGPKLTANFGQVLT